MTLPPGRGADRDHPAIQGISAEATPDLAQKSAELVTWLEYLLHPEKHDGPRVYENMSDSRDLRANLDDGQEGSAPHIPEATAEEVTRRYKELDEDPKFRSYSVIRGYDDLKQFFTVAEQVSGVRDSVLDPTYEKLAAGCFTWRFDDGASTSVVGSDPGRPITPEAGRIKKEDKRYVEQHPARIDWANMLARWEGEGYIGANEYTKDFIKYAVYTEVCSYVIAEALAKYRTIFHHAGIGVRDAMVTLMKGFERIGWGSRTDIVYDWFGLLVTGVAFALTLVIDHEPVTKKVLLNALVGQLASEVMAIKDKGSPVKIEDYDTAQELVEQYLTVVNSIGKDTEKAIVDLYTRTGQRIDALIEDRKYPRWRDEAAVSTVPHYADYLGYLNDGNGVVGARDSVEAAPPKSGPEWAADPSSTPSEAPVTAAPRRRPRSRATGSAGDDEYFEGFSAGEDAW